jgi:hypothetical protein
VTKEMFININVLLLFMTNINAALENDSASPFLGIFYTSDASNEEVRAGRKYASGIAANDSALKPTKSSSLKNYLLAGALLAGAGGIGYGVKEYTTPVQSSLTGTVDTMDLKKGGLEYTIGTNGKNVSFLIDGQSGVLSLEQIPAMFSENQLTNSSTCNFYMHLDSVLGSVNSTVQKEKEKYCN